MQPLAVEDLIAALELSATGPPTALPSGLGGNDLWRVPTGSGDLVLRVFPADRTAEVADREYVAHAFVRAHGLPAPRIRRRGMVAGRAVLAMDLVEGRSLAAALWSPNSSADDLGRQCGTLLAALHAITDPPPTPIQDRSWVDWAGELPAGVAERLRTDRTRRLLHLDFHPENLIVDDTGSITVLDWANAHLGPPAADLARTLSILELVRDAHPAGTPQNRAVLDQFTAGLLAGYAGAGGDPRIPDEIRGWAYAVQVRDLAGSWVPEWYFDRLRERCRELFAVPDR